MYYYWKDKTRIGPVGAERILELYEAGAISDSTLLWNKRERWPEWRRFGDVRAEISKAAKVRWHSGYLRGLARNTMFFRAFLVAAIAVMGVQIFYTARSYGLLLEYLGESAAAGGRRIQNLDCRGGQDIVFRKSHAGGGARLVRFQVL